ncbi:MAG: LOG family protein [SAR86 cluster bacterium]|uniref:AMP nucleosidase n=1 Tax=SAR86 cluster bacterium TaxID=2030880 RepID=A0A972VVQ5_9GAMM|nr:LOG family protein [SAR86 cluster bacterium]
MHLEVLSKQEVNKLLDKSLTGLYYSYRKCSLAVLNSGNHVDDAKSLLELYPDFDIRLIQLERGIRLELINAPAEALIEGKMIQGIKELLFAVLRDIIYVSNEITDNPLFDTLSSDGITDAIFHILRNAGIFKPMRPPNIVVCWGGHSIGRQEYDYTKDVGYQIGLRGMDICTGCGPGAMKGPMKGATIGHAKQRLPQGRYIGLSEPGIIAAEPPNPIVNELVIMPDIEKRLESFIRTGHGIIVFPGGVGTLEEILYLLGVLLHPDNANMPFPLIFTGPASAAEYFEKIHEFIGRTLGTEAQAFYQIIVDDPALVAAEMLKGMKRVRKFRKARNDAYYFNWLLKVDHEFQVPFEPNHTNMRGLQIHRDQPAYMLAANLRRAFSGLVAGNVKEEGIRAVEQHGLFEISGEPQLMAEIDALLLSFAEQHRMKLPGTKYNPCYKII